jgi:hypothetical protein
MKTRQIAVLMLAVLFAGVAATRGQDTDSDREKAAWNKVDQMDPKALEKFLVEFPDGKYAKDAKFDQSLHKKIDSIRAGKEKFGFVIPFEQLGQRWEDWKKRMPEKGALGIYRDENGAGMFRAMGAATMSSDYSGLLILPTGDGSILAVQTAGLKYSYINDIVFESGKDETLYFGVVSGKGLVHLHGKGKVTMPDKKETVLK